MNGDTAPPSQAERSELFVKVAAAAEISVGCIKRFAIRNRAIALANIDGDFFAFEDRCLHWGVRLSDGCLEGPVVRCRAHGWKHHVVKGEVIASDPPGDEGMRMATFDTRLEGGFVWVSTTAGRTGRLG